MKSPLPAMRVSDELVLEGSMPIEQRDRFLGNIVDEAHRSENILEEILRLASIESKTALENPSRISLIELCEKAEAALLPLATKNSTVFRNGFNVLGTIVGFGF